MLGAVAIKLVSCIDNDIANDQTNNLSLVSTSLPPSIPSQDELEKICELEKKIIAQGEQSKKVFERKIKIRGLETEMKKNKAEQDEKIKTLEETITVQSEIIAKLEEKSQSQDKKITELEEKLEEKSQSQDKKITELEERFQSLCQYINPTISTMITQIEDLSSHWI